eukprot:TRINITY_DN6681_c0_g1_i1.p1 TRINITY_DN6681_c0_g1~~TRINITY_DN6681_c0_g1_i1.p1  ORF type:complete len:338 (+),score=43.83 TRINITY_DN6681_c0_g1_i1:36-1049(+)
MPDISKYYRSVFIPTITGPLRDKLSNVCESSQPKAITKLSSDPIKQVVFHFVSGKIETLVVKGSDSLAQVKYMLFQRINIPVEYYQVLHNSKAVSDSTLVSSLGHQSTIDLHVLLDLFGGYRRRKKNYFKTPKKAKYLSRLHRVSYRRMIRDFEGRSSRTTAGVLSVKRPFLVSREKATVESTELYLLQCFNVNYLMAAIEARNVAEAKRYIGWGCDHVGPCKETPLHYAVYYNLPKIVELIIDKKVSMDPQNIEGDTPLHIACRKGYYDIALLLLRGKANHLLLNKKKETPIELIRDGYAQYKITDWLKSKNLSLKKPVIKRNLAPIVKKYQQILF